MSKNLRISCEGVEIGKSVYTLVLLYSWEVEIFVLRKNSTFQIVIVIESS